MADSTIVSVTEVRNALRCPRIFALGRMEKIAAFPVGSSCLGGTFHRLAERFARTVENRPPWFQEAEPKRSLDRWLLGMLGEELKQNPEIGRAHV